jgi:hypothetical protein
MRYIIEYKPRRMKSIHISQEAYWQVRYRRHPNGWRVIGIAGTWREAVVLAEQYCQRHLALDLHRSLLQKATLSPAEKRLLQKLNRRGRASQDRAGAGSG